MSKHGSLPALGAAQRSPPLSVVDPDVERAFQILDPTNEGLDKETLFRVLTAGSSPMSSDQMARTIRAMHLDDDEPDGTPRRVKLSDFSSWKTEETRCAPRTQQPTPNV